MASTKGVNLVANGSGTTLVTSTVNYQGSGTSVVTIGAVTTFPTAVTLQILQGSSGQWLPVNATAWTAAGVYTVNAPEGQYRLSTTGTSAGLYADLTSI